MWLRKVERKEGQLTATDTVAEIIALCIVSVQVRCVNLLQKIERRYSTVQKKIALLVFCTLFGGYCLWLLVRPVDGTGERSRMVMPEHNKGSPALIPPYRKDTTEHFKSNK